MIHAENLRKRFGAQQAVDGASFKAADGAVTGLLGPNGAGKTTSLRMIYGLMKPDGGTITVDGQDVASDPQSVQARLGVLPDQSGLYGRLTPREHIHYFGELHGLNATNLEKQVEKWIDALDLKALADRRVAGFSHGERTKVALARALVHDPQNIVLDEPTNGLDVMSTRAVRTVIRRLKAEGRCVLFSSHVMQEVSALCDRVFVMASGRVVAQGTADELLALTGMATLEDAFVRLVGPEAAGANGESV
jgi:sodium transport system ATP-binding protein